MKSYDKKYGKVEKQGNIIKKKQKLKVAMLGHKRVPSREGGIEVVVWELCTRMAKLGYQITCYNRRGHHVGGKEFTQKRKGMYKGVRLKNVFTINRRGWAAMTSSISAAFWAAFGNYDVVHFHAEGPCVMMWLPKLMGKRCIVTIHGLDHKRVKWGKLSSAYIMAGEKIAVRCADEIIVLSENARNYFMDTYHRKTQMIPNGVNAPVCRDAQMIQAHFGLNKNDYILFLGRLTPEKGIHYLIHAYKNLKTDKKLVIAGGASDTHQFVENIKQMAEDNPNIIFTGFIQGRLLEELYSNAYLFVLPSDLEGMPLTLLEAMSYGNCCVISDIPECTEVVEEYGVVFHHGDMFDLLEKLQQLCDSEETVEWYKSKSASFILQKYDWNDVVKRTLDLYCQKKGGSYHR